MVKIVKESISFNRQENPMKSVGIGRTQFFGFGTNLAGPEVNDGTKAFYIIDPFASKILMTSSGNNFKFKPEYDFWGTYKKYYKCIFRFRLSNGLYYTMGSSGSYGFGGMQFTKKETLCKRDKKNLLNQLYNYLYNLEISY